MVVTCDFEFNNNPDGTYFAGQVLTGKITLTADKPKQVQGIVLKVNGTAYTSWTEDHGYTYFMRSKTTKWYTGEEHYITSVSYLHGNDDNTQMMVIEPGIHTYSYSCHIPLKCPSSYEGTHGHVRYTVVVVLKRPWKFDQTYTHGFTVWNIVDLNNEGQRLKEPANTMLEKAFYCWPCKTEPLTVYVSLPQAGYVPGQRIPVSVLVTNNSNLSVDEVLVQLVMLVCYYSQSPKVRTRSERTIMAEHKVDSVMRHSKKLLSCQLDVPATPPSCHALCRLVQINYQVEVQIKMPFWQADQLLLLPVTIGNVPLMSIDGRQRQRQVEPTDTLTNGNGSIAATDELDTPTSPLPWAADASIAPPDFQTAKHASASNSGMVVSQPHEYGQRSFTPKYPVFTVPSPPASPSSEGFDPSDVTNTGVWI